MVTQTRDDFWCTDTEKLKRIFEWHTYEEL